MNSYTYEPPRPEVLRKMLKDYGMRRWQMARLLKVSEITVKRYLLPRTSAYHQVIPEARYRHLTTTLIGTHHPEIPQINVVVVDVDPSTNRSTKS